MALPRISIALFAFATVLGSLVLSQSTPAAAADQTVSVGDFYFCSADFEGSTCTTTVNVGDTVTWDFSGAATPHTSSSSSGGWNSGNVSPGGTFEFTFSEAGSFPYVCNIHPTLMMGTVVAQAAAAPTSAPAGGTTPPAGGTTPAAGATPAPLGATTGQMPVTGSGPQPDGDRDWLLLVSLAVAGTALVATGVTFARRGR
jgi:plastocyanin